jgi:hypothetical protein
MQDLRPTERSIRARFDPSMETARTTLILMMETKENSAHWTKSNNATSSKQKRTTN